MSKIEITFEKYNEALKNKAFGDFFKSISTLQSDTESIYVSYPTGLEESHDFFVLLFNAIESLTQQRLFKKYKLSKKTLEKEAFNTNKNTIFYKNIPVIKKEENNLGLMFITEYIFLNK